MLKAIFALVVSLTITQADFKSEISLREANTIITNDMSEQKLAVEFNEEEEQMMHIAQVKAQTEDTKSNEDEWMLFELTAYTNGAESTQKSKGHPLYGITASGKKTAEGRTVSADKKYPFGTVLYIDGLGERVVEDRGGAIKGNKLDVFIEDLSEAKKFGRKKDVKVKVVKMGEEK